MNSNLKLGLIIISMLTLCFAGATMTTGCDSLTGSDGGTEGDGGSSGDGGTCTPDCTGKACGADNGCGAKCSGTCDTGKECVNYQCIVSGCTPACDGKFCGEDDGCEGKCTDCENVDETCNLDTFVCEATTCEGDCTDKFCGEDDGCGFNCTDCATAGESCNMDTWACEAIPAGCNGVSFEGCCDGTNLKYCDPATDTVVEGDCVLDSDPAKHTCGWGTFNEGDLYGCGGSGEDPLGNYPIACP